MIEIKHQESQHRYGAFVDGQHAGFCQYELAGNTVTFTHTVVRPEFEGQGIGSSLAVFALEDCRARRQQVVPECSFLRQYIDRHGEFHDLLASSGDST
ncbi:MAG: N-acetyltransferase [Polaromonas sp.]|nr:N-acetyltransferase [Polaromonas sp.]